ncbi:MAG TPA: S9 family peptidase [Thermoanaerobaculales bacterium]|nr:S9 family peptidase [Thermoanaerobaculales bacterium]HQL31220.1 S9 family peptidase [Thermoanaerobaculales bacterium]
MAISRVRSAVAAAILALLLGPSCGAAGEFPTLDDLFGSDRFDDTAPDLVLWLPDGGGFLFRDTRDGRLGLFRHDVASGTDERIADWEALLGDLHRRRGGYVKPAMDDVNTHPGSGTSPTLGPDGRHLVGVTAGDLYLLELASGTARFLTEGAAPERFASFSPDGRQVAFVRDGDLYRLELESGLEHRLTDRAGSTTLLNGAADWAYEEELGVARSFWWSPGSDRILFVQYDTSPIPAFPITDELDAVAGVEWQRYPKAGDPNSIVRLGVVAAADGAIRWIPTGVGDGYLARAGWMPGGREVWFEVLDRDQTRLELRAAVPGESSSRLLLADESPDWVNVRDDLSFVGDDRFVWSSERDGWRHLYLYGVDGRLIRRLTAGRWQVEAVCGLDGDRTGVVFRATAEDPRERHIYRVGLDGGEPQLLTPGPGTHEALLAPDGRHLLDTFSSLSQPPRLELYTVKGRHLRTIDDGTIPALEGVDLVLPELGTVTADDGQLLYSWMFRPPGFDPAKRYPALVYVYGGPGAQSVVNEWGGTRLLYQMLLARRGLVVFTVDNRGSWGRGHAFEAAVHRRLGVFELADQLAGVRFLERQPWIDPERIGVYGGSYGGYMALMAMNKAPEHFAAGIAYAPVTDWRLYDSIYTERYMDRPEDNPDGYRDGSPVHFAAGLDGALLICHGLSDNNVHLQHTAQMAEQYQRAGKLFDLMVYPRVRHLIRTSHRRLHFHQLKTEFLERHLIQGGPRG